LEPIARIRFAERSGYTAIGTVCNLAAHLRAEAKYGQVLVAQRVAVAVAKTMVLEDIGALALKGVNAGRGSFQRAGIGRLAYC
jgi:class 3 adenylate cyclase